MGSSPHFLLCALQVTLEVWLVHPHALTPFCPDLNKPRAAESQTGLVGKEDRRWTGPGRIPLPVPTVALATGTANGLMEVISGLQPRFLQARPVLRAGFRAKVSLLPLSPKPGCALGSGEPSSPRGSQDVESQHMKAGPDKGERLSLSYLPWLTNRTATSQDEEQLLMF